MPVATSWSRECRRVLDDGAVRALPSQPGFLHDVFGFGDAAEGLVLSTDPEDDQSAAQTANPYVYGADNPTTFSDPTGLRISGCDGCSIRYDPAKNYRVKKSPKGKKVWVNTKPHAKIPPVPKSHRYIPPKPKPAVVKKKSGGWKDKVHLGLQGVGLIPGVSVVADGSDALLYLTQGKKVDAGISAISMVPALGDYTTVLRWGAKGAKAAKAAKESRDIEREASLMARANAARDARVSELSAGNAAGREKHSVVVGAYNIRTGNVAGGVSSKVIPECAEACAARAVGGDIGDVRFTVALRPRGSGRPPDVRPVCAAYCEPTYGRGAFSDPATQYDSDLIRGD